MLPIPTLMALLAVRACHVTAQIAQNRPSTAKAIQPRFPENCETLPADQTGTLRSLSLYEPYFGEYDKACIVTGSPCKVNGDCPVPRRDQCPQDRLGVSDDYKECIKGYENDREIKRYCANEYPTTGWVYAIKKAECIDGFCRGRGDAGTECDCLVGCGLKTSDSRDQSCIKGKCVAHECAPCGELPQNRACCGSGVIGHDGRCSCYTGGPTEGCGVDPKQCTKLGGTSVCCGPGTKFNGSCCHRGRCDSDCQRQ